MPLRPSLSGVQSNPSLPTRQEELGRARVGCAMFAIDGSLLPKWNNVTLVLRVLDYDLKYKILPINSRADLEERIYSLRRGSDTVLRARTNLIESKQESCKKSKEWVSKVLYDQDSETRLAPGGRHWSIGTLGTDGGLKERLGGREGWTPRLAAVLDLPYPLGRTRQGERGTLGYAELPPGPPKRTTLAALGQEAGVAQASLRQEAPEPEVAEAVAKLEEVLSSRPRMLDADFALLLGPAVEAVVSRKPTLQTSVTELVEASFRRDKESVRPQVKGGEPPALITCVACVTSVNVRNVWLR